MIIKVARSEMLTAKGKYGLKALAHLASLEPGARAQAIDIAEVHNIPNKFLNVILSDLRNVGIVLAKKGPGGGYMLARAPSEIRLGEVIRVIDGPLAPLACASRTAYKACKDCRDVKTCTVRITMTSVRDAIAKILDHMSVADLIARHDVRKNLTPSNVPPHVSPRKRRTQNKRAR
jgi:Rrf2 family protein